MLLYYDGVMRLTSLLEFPNNFCLSVTAAPGHWRNYWEG